MKLTEYCITVDDELLQRFQASASAHGRAGDQVLREFMQAFARQSESDYDTWFIQQVQIGIDAANAGELVSGEEVEAEFAARRVKTVK